MNQATINNEIRIALPAEFHQMDPEEKKRIYAASAVVPEWCALDPERHIIRLANLITDPAAEREALSAAPGGYDLVTANIIAEILAELTPHIPALLRKGGIYVTSGILAEKEALVRKAVEEDGLTYLEIRYQGEWCSVVARK